MVEKRAAAFNENGRLFRGGCIPKRWAGGAATLPLVLVEQGLETANHFGLLAIEVAALGQVSPQIVEFAGELVGAIAALLLEPVGFARAAPVAVAVTAWSINQDPVALPKG